MIYPMKFQPIYKEKVWGGRKLEKLLNKEVDTCELIGESWELSCRKDDSSVVSNGVFKGLTANQVFKTHAKEILGEKHKEYKERFPLLIKFIDANDNLSVQVHPDDEFAIANEDDLGKTEMWYILDAEPKSKLVYGLKEDIEYRAFVDAVNNNKIKETLNEIEVKKGDIIYIPAGTIHAIGEGIVLAEIQQSSDITYRIYDWDRLGLDGRPRELHVDKALQVIDFDLNKNLCQADGEIIEERNHIKIKYSYDPFFSIEILNIHNRYSDNLLGEKFETLTVIDGEAEIIYKGNRTEFINKGETILLPAQLGEYTITGQCEIIKAFV